MTEQAELNLKYGPLFDDQSKRTKNKMKLHNLTTEIQNEQEKDQSQMNGTSEKTQNVTKNEQNKITTSRQSEIGTPKISCKSTIEIMDNKNIYHWGATREILEIIRRRNNSTETRRLVEQRNSLSRPGTLRRRYDHQSQRTSFAPSRSNKRSRKEGAEVDEN